MIEKGVLVDSIGKLIGIYEKELAEHSEAETLMLYVEGQRDMLLRMLAAIEKGDFDHVERDSPIQRLSNCS